MSKATFELDFFGMEKGIITNTPKKSPPHTHQAISRIRPELLKSMIAASWRPETSAATAGHPLPSMSSSSRVNMENFTDTTPLTIFYKGTVTVFDVSKDKADTIIKFAEREVVPQIVEPSDTKIAVTLAGGQRLLDALNEELPIARKKSLQRFLEKRKERLTSVSPLASSRNTRF